MTGGWAATNTLRDGPAKFGQIALGGDVTYERLKPALDEFDDALALVEAALDAAETLRQHGHNEPTLMSEMTYEEWARIRMALHANLAAALRAVREGK